MIQRPCIECGEVTEHARCAEHTVCAVKVHVKGHVHLNGARWKALSKRVRRAMPWCEDCGSTEHLQADHVVPVSIRPEWAYELANLTTRCATCNGSKGNTMPNESVVREIEDRIAARRRRTRGEGVDVRGVPSAGEAKSASLTPGGIGSEHDGTTRFLGSLGRLGFRDIPPSVRRVGTAHAVPFVDDEQASSVELVGRRVGKVLDLVLGVQREVSHVPSLP